MPRWDSTAVNLVVPPSGQLDTGWTTGQVAVSSYDNWYKNLVWQWLNWLNGNVWDGNIEFTGNVQVDGTFESIGRITAQEKIYAAGGLYGSAGGVALAPVGLTCATGNITASTGTVTGTDLHFTSPHVLTIPASEATVSTSGGSPGAFGHFDATYKTLDYYTFHNSVNPVIFDVILPTGAVIVSWGCYINKTSNGTQTVHVQLVKIDSTTGTITAADSANASGGSTSAANPGYVALAPSNTPSVPTIATGAAYQIIVYTNGALDSEDSVLSAAVAYTY